MDIGLFIKLWGQKDIKADINKDGIINTIDYGAMLKKFVK